MLLVHICVQLKIVADDIKESLAERQKRKQIPSFSDPHIKREDQASWRVP
jgi:hypothetical protein